MSMLDGKNLVPVFPRLRCGPLAADRALTICHDRIFMLLYISATPYIQTVIVDTEIHCDIRTTAYNIAMDCRILKFCCTCNKAYVFRHASVSSCTHYANRAR